METRSSRRQQQMVNFSDIYDNTKFGLEIETCIYPANQEDEIELWEVEMNFYEELKECLENSNPKMDMFNNAVGDTNDNYDKWMIVQDASIKCPSTKEEKENFEEEFEIDSREFILSKSYKIREDEDDGFLTYFPVEIVTSAYNIKDIDVLFQEHFKCLNSDNYAYGFNSSQGIHYNISNSILNKYNEKDRKDAIERILTLIFILEEMIVNWLPEYRKHEVYSGRFCKSLRLIFINKELLSKNWLRFYSKKEDIYEGVSAGTDEEYISKYTLLNLKNIYPQDTSNVVFEFRLGSIHMNKELMKSWIILLSTLISIAIENKEYFSKLCNLEGESNETQEDILGEILNEKREESLGVIERLPKDGEPGSG